LRSFEEKWGLKGFPALRVSLGRRVLRVKRGPREIRGTREILVCQGLMGPRESPVSKALWDLPGPIF